MAKQKRKPKGYYTKETIREELQARKDAGLGLKSLDANREFGGLYKAAKRVYGSYEAALAEIGMELEGKRRPNGYFTAETVLTEIQRRDNQGLSLHAKKIVDEEGGLYDAAKNFYGNWVDAVESAGIDVGKKGLRRHKRYNKNGVWTKETLMQSIKELDEQGVKLSMVNIREIHGTLVAQASILYGGWYNALKASGVDADSVQALRAVQQWTKELVVEGIQQRENEGKSNLHGVVGKEDANLYSAARRYYGTWEEAVKESGLNIKDYLVRGAKGYWEEATVIREIQAREGKGLSLEPSVILAEDRALYENARVYCGGYRQALEKSGYNPKDYYPKSIGVQYHYKERQGG